MSTIRTSMTIMLVAAVATTCATAQAVIINFDIGPLGGLDGDGGLPQTSYASVDFNNNGQPDVWNRFGQIAGGTAFGGVQDINGNELAGVTGRADGVANRDGNAGLNAGWGTAQEVDQAVINSWYFRGSGTMTFTVAGLDPNAKYNVELFNAFNTGPNTSDMQINGLFADGTAGPSSASDGDNWDRNVNGFTPKTGLLFQGISPNGSGQFIATFTGGNPTVQAVRIAQIQVPEPSTLALAALGMLGLACFRRRRK